jgi:hypothetical protein
MSRSELLQDLLVPFCSSKEDDASAIGEHGIGFFSALELAPRLELTTTTRHEEWRLAIEPIGKGPPFRDFGWTLTPLVPRCRESIRRETRSAPTGTSLRLSLAHPLGETTLVADVTTAAGLVDPTTARIYVNDTLVNTARARLRRVARAAIDGMSAELELFLGRGEGLEPQLTVTQGGLLVAARQDAFTGRDLGLHRDLARAITAAGFALVVNLPTCVPLNKGRSGVVAHATGAVDRALVAAFERFVLEDALYNRELLRAVDHRLASVLDRLVTGVLIGETAASAAAANTQAAADPHDDPQALRTEELSAQPIAESPLAALDAVSAAARGPDDKVPTVAAPGEVVRFATLLVQMPLFKTVAFDGCLGEMAQTVTLRDVLTAHRAGVLRVLGEPIVGGYVYLSIGDPLAQALWRRLATSDDVMPPGATPGGDSLNAREAGSLTMQRVSRDLVVEAAGSLRGIDALDAAMILLEQIDRTISMAGDLSPSPILVHQDLYGPDEMAHTDGQGISVNIASPRVRGLIIASLAADDPVALGALVDLLVHEKTHVALASYVPRSTAEHGTSFYRRKDQIRRRLLVALASGSAPDPMVMLPALRSRLQTFMLPSPEALAAAVGRLATAA